MSIGAHGSFARLPTLLIPALLQPRSCIWLSLARETVLPHWLAVYYLTRPNHPFRLLTTLNSATMASRSFAQTVRAAPTRSLLSSVRNYSDKAFPTQPISSSTSPKTASEPSADTETTHFGFQTVKASQKAEKGFTSHSIFSFN